MATQEEELKNLRETNNELVQKVQYWKMTAAQREDEKLALMKEINELRLKLSRLRSTGGIQARQFDSAIQATSERALAHLVQASGDIAHTIELAKSYMRDRQELDESSPRWSSIGGTPAEKTERVHRVPPMMMGGQSIQPVVALSRTLFNTSTRPASRSPNPSLTGRPVPMHVIQDVYIPLTRIDAGDRQADNVDVDVDVDNSTEDLGLEESIERMDESQDASESQDFEASRRLEAVTEDIEPEQEVQTPPTRNKIDNPLEGPSWLLDSPAQAQSTRSRAGVNLEPDSTTEVDEAACVSPPTDEPGEEAGGLNVPCEPIDSAGGASCVFSPTVRRRKRTHSPLSPTIPHARNHSPIAISRRRNSNSGRVLKVLVAKMRLSSASEHASPRRSPSVSSAASAASVTSAMSPAPTALTRFDAPSPNGATDAALLVEPNTDNMIHPLEISIRDPVPQHSRRGSRHDCTRPIPTKQPKWTDRVDNPEPHDRTDRHDKSGRNTPEVRHDKSGRNTPEVRHDMSDRNRSGSVSMERGSRAGSETSVVSSDGRDSDGDLARAGRTRRTRKPITYKEKPLNRKLRR